MSTLIENVAKVKSAYNALSTSIEAKGVSVPVGTKLSEMPALVDQIQTGGGSEDYGYLTFTAQQASTLKMKNKGNIELPKLLKSTDAVNWERWNNPDTNTISLSSGQSVYIKAADDASYRTATSSSDNSSFVITGKIQVSGDIRSIVRLVAPADYSYWLAQLFSGCTYLSKTPELPATTLTYGCYGNMFNGCSSFIQAPELPATTLATSCYSYMFNYCMSMKQAPELPATTLVNNCYGNMFNYCTSITQAPELPATTLAENCYQNMFQNCSSLKRIKMNASSGSWGNNMFNSCTSLELVDMTGSIGVPTLSNVNNFSNTNDTYKIVVPDSLYETWINETNWASISTHIMKQSDWNAAHPDDQL